MKVLIHIAAKGNSSVVCNTYFKYKSLVGDTENTEFNFSIDFTDKELNNTAFLGFLEREPNVNYMVIHNENKVQAINNICVLTNNWDVLLYSHVDMVPLFKNFDGVIKDKMRAVYPGLDGVLIFKDECICIGRNYYDQDKFIFHPDFKETSFFYLRNFIARAEKRGKITLMDEKISGHCREENKAIESVNRPEYKSDKDVFFNLKLLS